MSQLHSYTELSVDTGPTMSSPRRGGGGEGSKPKAKVAKQEQDYKGKTTQR